MIDIEPQAGTDDVSLGCNKHGGQAGQEMMNSIGALSLTNFHRHGFIFILQAGTAFIFFIMFSINLRLGQTIAGHR